LNNLHQTHQPYELLFFHEEFHQIMISFLQAISESLLLYHQSLSAFSGKLPHQVVAKASLGLLELPFQE